MQKSEEIQQNNQKDGKEDFQEIEVQKKQEVPNQKKKKNQNPPKKQNQEKKKQSENNPANQNTKNSDEAKILEQADNELIKNINLPEKKKFDFRLNSYPQWEKELPDDEAKNAAKVISDYLDENLEIWDLSNKKDIDFNLPESIFTGKKPVIQLVEPTYEVEKLEVEELNSKQLNQICQTGTFEVPSKKFSIPYTWKISELFVSGRDQIIQNLYFIFALMINVILYMMGRFYRRHSKSTQRNYPQTFKDPIIFDGIKRIFYYFPKKLYRSFFGVYEHRIPDQKTVKLQTLSNQLKQRSIEYYQKNICQSDDKLDIAFQEEFSHNSYIQNSYVQIEQKFLSEEWELKLMQSVLNEYDKEDPEYFKKVKRDQLYLFYDYLEKRKPEKVTVQAHDSFLRYLKTYWIVQEYEEQYQSELIKANVKIFEKLKKDHPIKSQSIFWLKMTQVTQLQLEKQRLRKFTDEKIAEELLKAKLVFQSDFYRYISKFYKQFQENQENYVENYVKTLPCYTTDLQYTDSVQYQVKQSPHDKRYYLEYCAKQTLKYSNLWKLKFFFFRVIRYTQSIFFNMCFCLWLGESGLKSLFYWKSFPSTIMLMSNITGEYKGNMYFTPVIKTFLDNFTTIKQLNKQFEQTPDTAFFGKKWSKYFHYFECYFLRMIIQGFGIKLFLNAVMHVFSIIFVTLIMLTCFVWGFLGTLIQYIWTIIGYDFDREIMYNWRGTNFLAFPIFLIIFDLLINGVFQIVFAILHVIVLDPVTLVILFAFGILRFVFRMVYDFFMFQIIKIGARVPVRENNIAWRIKGPGVGNRRQYKKIQEDDVYLLVRSYLEHLQLQHYDQLVRKLIEQTTADAQKTYDKMLKGFHVQRIDAFKEIKDAEKLLINRLVYQINVRKACFPQINAHMIKFTDEELDKLIPITTEIIQGQVQANNMAYIWQQVGVDKDNWKQLTSIIWERVFQTKDVLQGLDEDEMSERHEINRQVCQEAYDKVLGKAKIDNIDISKSSFKRSTYSKAKRQQKKEDDQMESYYNSNKQEFQDLVQNNHMSVQQIGQMKADNAKINLAQGFSSINSIFEMAYNANDPIAYLNQLKLDSFQLFIYYNSILESKAQKSNKQKKDQ